MRTFGAERNHTYPEVLIVLGRPACIRVALCLSMALAVGIVVTSSASAQPPPFVTNWGVSGSGDGQLLDPRGIAQAPSGEVYIADSNNHRIQRFTSSGAYVGKWGSNGSGPGQFVFPYSIAVDASGSVYVADRFNNRIQKFSGTGTYLMEWGTGGSGNGQFSEPYGVAVDGSSNVYVVDVGNNRLQKFTSNGTFLTQWGGFVAPLGVAVSASGFVYVSDESGRVQKFTGNGTFITQWGGFSLPYGLAVDAIGDVYVTDHGSGLIRKFSGDGALISEWGSSGTAVGQFSSPSDVLVSGPAIFVLDSGNSRVQVYGSGLASSAAVNALSPPGTVSPATPALTVPVTLTRTDATPILGYSVRFHLSGLALSGSGTSGISPADFLGADNPTTAFQVIDNGGGTYTVDNVTLGTPCGSTAVAGTLFNVAVGSNVLAGPGLLTLDEVTVFDCSNVATSFPVGTAASVAVDFTLPVVTLSAPNGGDLSPLTITWAAADNVAVALVDLALSTDGGATFPYTIAAAIPNSETLAWTPPPVVTTHARVRVTAHDVNGNTASDTSDADFTLGRYLLSVSVTDGTVTWVPGEASYLLGTEVRLTASPAPGFHFADWAGDLTGSTNPATIVMDGHKSVTANMVLNPPVAPITALTVSQLTAGNDADGTTELRVDWPAAAAGDSVHVYRAGFGGYPRYDDLGGTAPLVPAFPPPAPWVLTNLISPGSTDEPTERDYYYYVAFVTDSYGTLSPASNLAGGVLNYHLGDVADGVTTGQGDNHVGVPDLSLLGFHYGAAGAALVGFESLDVGPTTDRTVHGRPTTDGRINIEDLLIFGLNYEAVGAPALTLQPAATLGPDELTLRVTESSSGSVVAHIDMHGSGAVQALSTVLAWNTDVVAPTEWASGQFLVDQQGVVMSPSPGSVDATLLGARARGMSGAGELATITFRRLKPGDEGVFIRSAMARSAANKDLPLVTRRQIAGIPQITALAAAVPNPFQSTAALSFSLSRPGPVALEIYSVDGRHVRTLAREARDAGEYRIEWDGRDDLGQPLSAGIYYARLSTPLGQVRRKLVRLK
ncbi:MAG: FlgD immunoglobulin-like domain containing protein [Candidatus Eisenbacteria bacterium]